MKYINSGCGKMPLMSLVAILSISLTVNLPGLAISPIMGKLSEVFKNVTELEVQLLTVLPNLVTIPFILCSGKICTPKNQVTILGIGLGIYTLSGVLYFFAKSMIVLILLSCLLGVGCGLVIPLAASLISQNFVGKARTRQLGMKSGISNFTVIFATLFVGWIATINWHLSFIVYMVPIIPLLLIPYMTNSYIAKNRIPSARGNLDPHKEPAKQSVDDINKTAFTGKPANPNFHYQGKTSLYLLGGVMLLYFMATYGTEVVSYYLPFSMKHYGLNTGDVGVATAMFFASATLSGFFLNKALSWIGKYTMQVAFLFVIVGLFCVGFIHHYWSFVFGVFIMGLGYGVIQPIIYDKTSYIAPNTAKSTEYFSYLLTCNYIGISTVPFIISGAKHIFVGGDNPNFSFIFNGFIMVIVLCVTIWKRNSFVVEADPNSYEVKPASVNTKDVQTTTVKTSGQNSGED